MAIDTNALSLAGWQKLSNDPLIKEITVSLFKQCNVLADIPFRNYKSMSAKGTRWDGSSMPTVTYRDINEAPTATFAVPVTYSEGMGIFAKFIDMDEFLRDDVNNISDPMAQQMKILIEALTYDVNDKWINNDHITGNAKAQIGLKYRLTNRAQYDIPAACVIDAAGVNMKYRTGSITQIYALTFFSLLDELLIALKSPEGDGVVLYMDQDLHIAISYAAKIAGPGGGLDTTKDEYDHIVKTYRNAKLKIIGVKADQTTKIIGYETATGTAYVSGDKFTSLYAVHFGTEEMYGWQWEPMKPRYSNPDEVVIQRMLLQYAWGYMFDDTRCIGRMYDILIG